MEYLSEEIWRHNPQDDGYHELVIDCGAQTLEETVPGAWLIIECGPDDAENLEAKISLFNRVQKLAHSDAIIATNSVLYRLEDIATDLRIDPETTQRMLTVHYFSPPEIRLVELQAWRGTKTGVLSLVKSALEECDMVPVVAMKEYPGLVLSRVWAAIVREISTIRSQNVASQVTLDKAWTEVFIKSQLTPCIMMDRQGLENLARIERDYINNRGLRDTEGIDYLQQLIEQGRVGASSDQGGLCPPMDLEPPTPVLYVLEFMGNGYLSGSDPKPVRLLFGPANSHFPEGTTDLDPLLLGAKYYGLAVSHPLETLFWSLTDLDGGGDSAIMTSDLRGGHAEPLIPPGVVYAPSRVAIDERRRKLYFTDCGGMRVFGCNLDGTGLELLYRSMGWTDTSPCLNFPSGDITFSAKFDLLYWIVRSPCPQKGGKIYWGPAEKPDGCNPDTRPDVDDYAGCLRDPIAIEVGEDGDLESIYWSETSAWDDINSLNRTTTACRERVSMWDKSAGLTQLAMDKRTSGRQVYAADSYRRGGVYLFDMGPGETLQKNIYRSDEMIMCFGLGFPPFKRT
ncbi:hypothetical protein B0I37DRAFT_348993 [Chaetomium sp. MPI-CAGE-AT-0009]|nr:hypothetical protein B0I37DRAFT_348993 [Chaetomium sp. MPI-CAGE-AT-0009]